MYHCSFSYADPTSVSTQDFELKYDKTVDNASHWFDDYIDNDLSIYRVVVVNYLSKTYLKLNFLSAISSYLQTYLHHFVKIEHRLQIQYLRVKTLKL